MRLLLRAILLLGDLVLVALFVGGNVAYYVAPPSLWFLQLLALAVPYLGIGVATVAVGALLGKRWKVFTLHAALWLIAVTGATLTAPANAAREVGEDAPVLRVATFNARGATLKQAQAFRDLLGTAQPHLFSFQELAIQALEWTGRVQGGGVTVPLLKEAGFTPSQPVNDRYVLTSQPVFSRLKAAGPGRVLAGYPAEGLWKSGGINRAIYEWQGRPIAVYSVHLHSFSAKRPWRENRRLALSLSAWLEALRSYRIDFQVRAEQARRLRELLESEPYPFIVCGDLNSTPRNWVYAHLARGLQDAFRQAGEGWGGTYHARLPLFRIDFIFASEEWEIRSAQVRKAISSDHHPLMAELVLSPPAELSSVTKRRGRTYE